VVAGDGPLLDGLRSAHPEVRFTGQVSQEELAELRARAALAIVPSRAAETFGLAAAEALAAGVPTIASRMGALPDLVDDVVAPGDAMALAAAARERWQDAAAGTRGIERVRERCAPVAVAQALATVYGA
jgi:glycosyltransferase involved in cell wall biosynthesis